MQLLEAHVPGGGGAGGVEDDAGVDLAEVGGAVVRGHVGVAVAQARAAAHHIGHVSRVT